MKKLLTITSFLLVASTAVMAFDWTPKQESMLREAKELVEQFEYKSAANLYEKLATASIGDHETAAQMFYQRAECLYFAGKYYKADKAYRDLVEKYRLQVPLNVVFERLRQIACNFEDGKGTFLGISDTLSAIKIYEFIIAKTPSVSASLEDRYRLAARYHADGQINESVAEYQTIIKELPREPRARYELALLLRETAAKSDGDGRVSKAAAREAKAYLELNAGDEEKDETMRQTLKQCEENEAQRLLGLAKYYLSKRHYKPEAAKRYLHDIKFNFPESAAAAEANALLADNQE